MKRWKLRLHPMRNNFLLSPKLLKVVFGVLMGHLLAFSIFCIPKVPKIKKNKIKIHTTLIKNSHENPSSAKKLKTNRETIASHKKQTKIAKPLQKKLVKPQNNFAKELEKYFKSFESDEDLSQKNTSSLPIPQKIDKLKIQTASLENASIIDNYESDLINYLQEKLELPSFGNTKIKLSIGPDGKLKRLEVLQSESNENIQYLKNQLHSLTYPCFNCSNEAKNFIINFSNLE